MSPFDSFPKSPLDVVAPGGTLRCKTTGIVSSSTEMTIFDPSAHIEIGDEIRRLLQNGLEETYEVEDAVFHEKFHSIPAHYEVTTRRKGAFPAHTGGHYIHVTGPNARVNINSTDNSTNTVIHGSLLGDLVAAIDAGVPEGADKTAMLEAVEALKASTDKPAKAGAYQRLIANAANHMTIIAPFLSELTKLL